MPETIHCPNCGAPAGSAPDPCAACGYRPAIGLEYLWLYCGGLAFILLGFALGAVGVAIEGAPPEHWSRALEGWFPLAPWPESYHWLSFLVTGIAFTIAGMGLTRRRPGAWFALAAIVLHATVWTLLAFTGVVGKSGAPAAASRILVAEILLILLAARCGLSIRRTPPRDAARVRAAAGGR